MMNDTQLCEWLRANSSEHLLASPTHCHVAPTHQAADRLEETLRMIDELNSLVRNLKQKIQ